MKHGALKKLLEESKEDLISAWKDKCSATATKHAQSLNHIQRFFDPIECSPPGSSVYGILHARILEWVAISSSRGNEGRGSSLKAGEKSQQTMANDPRGKVYNHEGSCLHHWKESEFISRKQEEEQILEGSAWVPFGT